MTLSLRTKNLTLGALILFGLTALLALGYRQYRFQQQYETLITGNEQILFRFSSLREHITESLIEQRHQLLPALIPELEELNNHISRILQEDLIPAEYRLSFGNQIDLPGITLLLRNIAAGTPGAGDIRHLNQEIRLLGERLVLFDRMVVSHIRKRLVGFQSVVIGILALAVFAMINGVFLWQRRLAGPLATLHGQLRQYAAGAQVFFSAPGQGLMADFAASLQDISQRHSLCESERAALAQIVEAWDAALFRLAPDGTVRMANQEARHLAESLGRPLTSVSTLFGGKEGTVLDELKTALVQGSALAERQATLGGRSFRLRLVPAPGEGGESSLFLRDLGSQNKWEIDQLKASKLAATGELTIGVAHEISNSINGLINFAQILADDLQEGDPPARGQVVANINREGERISALVRQLLAFNGSRSQLIESVQIKTVFDETLALMRHQMLTDNIQVSNRLPADLPRVRVNVQEMKHVLLNILNNARHALNTRYGERHQNKCIEAAGELVNSDGLPRLRVTITDLGCGIEPHLQEKLFTPFFTTKAADQGTGLGLSICKSLVEDNRGSIRVESIPGRHTTVAVELPLH